MSYKTAKYILWVLLFLPFIALCIYMLDDILGDVLNLRKAALKEKKAAKKADALKKSRPPIRFKGNGMPGGRL